MHLGFQNFAIDFGMANASSYYSITTEIEVGYAFQENWFAFVGADVTRRSLAVYMIPDGQEDVLQVGVLDDHGHQEPAARLQQHYRPHH